MKDVSPEEQAVAGRPAVPYDIPVEGTLGLLALGDVGLALWRKKREEAERARSQEAQKADG
jgi:hypothetical protein